MYMQHLEYINKTLGGREELELQVTFIFKIIGHCQFTQ